MTADEVRDGVGLTSLGSPVRSGEATTKRELIDYLDAVHGPLVAALTDRPLSVMRVRPGQAPFMQKNLPRHAPDWIARTEVWAEASKRQITYALCNDRRTLLWFANQRAVEYHPTLFQVSGGWERPTHLVLDIDPPEGGTFGLVVQAALLLRDTLADAGLAGAVKTSGAKGLHVFVPLSSGTTADVAAATRALTARAERLDPALTTTAFVREERHGKVFLDSTRVGGASVAAVYSPRLRLGWPVSFPVSWSELDQVTPADFTVRTAPGLLAACDPWRDEMPGPQELPAELVAEGHEIPVARVQAMHAGKRRAREQRQ